MPDTVRLIESTTGSNHWSVREFVPSAAFNRAPVSLICENESAVRRLWTFPKDWGTLGDADLLALFDIS